jgi:hypothetical protein
MNFGQRRFQAENWSVLVLANATQQIWAYTVPFKCELELVEFGNYMDTVAAWGINSFVFTQNLVPISWAGGYPAIMDQVGYAAQRAKFDPIRFTGGNLLQCWGVEATGGNVQMGISIGYNLIDQE